MAVPSITASLTKEKISLRDSFLAKKEETFQTSTEDLNDVYTKN